MIVYLDSSLLARAYLPDEPEHQKAIALLTDPNVLLFTGTWTRIEVSGALVRAARSGRGDEEGLLSLLDADLGLEGPVTVIASDQEQTESLALDLVRSHGIRAMDAWHLAVAQLVGQSLTEPGEEIGFATRDQSQSAVAELLGLRTV